MVRGMLANRVGKGQRLRPHTLRGQMMLQGLAAMRHWRRRSQRHATEAAHIDQWLSQVKALMQDDTHWRWNSSPAGAWSKVTATPMHAAAASSNRLSRAAALLKGRRDAAADLATLRADALADPQGTQLKQRWTLLGLPDD